MPLGPDDWPRVREVFESALALPGHERAAYLAAACGSHQALRDEVERMLDSHGRAAGFLSTPAAAPLDVSIAAALDGRRIGPYQLGSRIGAGGMGEVYRARDTRLDRMVAIKVLPSDLVHDPYARERFGREGRAIAALNHPNICALFDVGDTSGSDLPFYLVMEYLEGETLAERLARGALPILQALQVGAQIASALDKAHRAGIVHRDLKPGNVFLLRSSGSAAPTAKLLDFGLAKIATPRAAASATRHAIAASLTVSGAIVGTVQYMAPEQVEGKEVDARTDIFALGVVLHEMLTGAKAFAGTTQATLTVAILEHDPPAVSSCVPSASAALDRVVARCLAKDPEQRWQSAADLASELQWIVDGGGTLAQPRAANRTLPRFVAFAVVFVAALAAAGAVFVLRPSAPVAPATKQFTVAVPIGLQAYVGRRVAVVPDGSGFVYPSGGSASRDFRWMLHTFADGVSRPLPHSEGAFSPFFSPDGTWVAFFQENRLKKIATNGGPAFDICEADAGGGGSWGPDNQIVFTRHDGLWRVSAQGGSPQRLTSLSPSESGHADPVILPRGDAVLFTTRSKTGTLGDATVSAVSMRGGEPRLLVNGAASARYAATGHLLYVRGSDLLAAAFDSDRMIITGNPVRVLDSVQTEQQDLTAQYDVAGDGTIAYITGTGEPQRTLVWADRDGTLRPIPAPPQPYAHPVLLPDGQGLIVEIEKTPHDLWHYDFLSGALTRLTFEGGNHHAVLSPDGHLMAFPSDRTAPRNLFLQRTDGSGAAERLYQAPYYQTSESWSRDGRWLAFSQLHPQTQSDIWVLAMTGERRARPFLTTPYIERSAVFSPDGRWIAYVSNESGRYETFISPFPGPGARKQVSTDGGEVPLFSEDGRTLYYKSGERIMAADVVTEPAIRIGAPRVAFETPGAARVTVLPFPVTANGNSVLYVREPEDVDRAVHVKVNWFEELRRITAAK